MDQNLASKIRKIFRKEPEVMAVYCFGSFAKGEASLRSDFDLALVVRHRKLVNPNRIYDLVKNLKFPRDLDLSLVDKTSPPIFLYQIITNGKRIYEADEQEVGLFEAYVLREYYDNAHMRHIYYQYLGKKFPLKTYADQ